MGAGDPTGVGAGRPTDGTSVRELVHRLDRGLPFASLSTEPTASTTWCADVLSHVRAGADPLAPWRTALRGQMAHRHGAAVPAHVPAAFVLQWWCEVAATPLAHAAALGPWVLAPDASALGFELAPGLYPHRFVVDPDRTALEAEPDPTRREARSRQVYAGLVREVVEAFAPDVRMGSRQRWGVVDDVWSMTSRRAAGAAGLVTGPEPRRVSCCFIYALPGMRECASCPRGARPSPGGGRELG